MKVNLLLQITYFFQIYQLNIGVSTLLKWKCISLSLSGKNDILLLFLKCNSKRFVLYESHGFTSSSTYIKIQSFFPDTDVNMSAMVIWLKMKKLTTEIAKNDAWQTAFFVDFICLTTRITATVFRSFVTNVFFLCCYVTLHGQHMHSWSGNNKKMKFNIFLRFDIFYVTINHQSFLQKIVV
jgi:hypothetical protein